MAFNHDNFVASAPYQALDASLDWYITAVKPKVETLQALRDHHPEKLVLLNSRDPVLRKLRKIARFLDRFAEQLEIEP